MRPGVKLLCVASEQGLHAVNTLLGSVVRSIVSDRSSGVAAWLDQHRCAMAVGRTIVVFDIGR